MLARRAKRENLAAGFTGIKRGLAGKSTVGAVWIGPIAASRRGLVGPS